MAMASSGGGAGDPTRTGNNGLAVTLTVRLIMQGKEVGSIIGKKGDTVKKFREQSGAKINISDGSCPERIITVTGSTEAILKAFSLIAQKFEEGFSIGVPHLAHRAPQIGPRIKSSAITGEALKDLQASMIGIGVPKPPVTLRLIVPATQCGSLIGKGGSKIKDIREATGASVQVASEMLPNSTERAVTISGTADAITKCIHQICCIMMESPPKGPTLPYRPKQVMSPLIFSGGQAYALPGQYALPHSELNKLQQLALQHATVPILPGHSVNPPQVWATLAATGSLRPSTTTEMSIPNDFIGCIIGKGGIKINEIRHMSGAVVKVSNSEEGSTDRTVTISGTPEAVHMAQYLVNASLEQHKKNLELNASAATASSSSHLPTTVNLTSTFAAAPTSPLALSLAPLIKASPLTMGLDPRLLRNSAALFSANFSQFQAKAIAGKLKTASAIANTLKKDERNKFAPY